MIRTKKRVLFIALLLFVIASMIFVYCIGPEKVIDKIGIHNTYLFIFFISLISGFSAWTSFSMIALLVTFTAKGINPIYLGLISGIGLAMGDLIMFMIFSKGIVLVSRRWEKRIRKFSRFFEEKHRRLIPFVVYVYIGLTPLPNDFLIIFLGILGYPIKRAYIPIILGDLTYPFMITFLATRGIIG